MSYIGNGGVGGGSSTTSSNTHSAGPTPHTAAIVGDSWHDTDVGVVYFRTNDGVQDMWIDISSGAPQPLFTYSATPPVTPKIGDHWHDADDDRIYIRSNSGVTQIWKEI